MKPELKKVNDMRRLTLGNTRFSQWSWCTTTHTNNRISSLHRDINLLHVINLVECSLLLQCLHQVMNIQRKYP